MYTKQSYKPSTYFYTYKGLTITVQGGPFAFAPDDTYNVCMLPRVPTNVHANQHVPTQDFTPPPEDLLAAALLPTIKAGLRGETIYIGCTAGIGRTGTFMAVMLKALGEAHPVSYVRAAYHGHAVETEDQRDLVDGFDVRHVEHALRWTVWGEKFKRAMGLRK
jgi:hypothetical protein